MSLHLEHEKAPKTGAFDESGKVLGCSENPEPLILSGDLAGLPALQPKGDENHPNVVAGISLVDVGQRNQQAVIRDV